MTSLPAHWTNAEKADARLLEYIRVRSLLKYPEVTESLFKSWQRFNKLSGRNETREQALQRTITCQCTACLAHAKVAQ